MGRGGGQGVVDNTQPCPVASSVLHSGWPGMLISQHSNSGSPVRWVTVTDPGGISVAVAREA